MRRCPECGARMRQWDTTCAVCEASVDVVPVPRIPIPASALVGVMALLLLLFAAWFYQPWALLPAVPTPTFSTDLVPVAAATVEPTATTTPVIVPTLRPVTVTHTVQPGETLGSIAKRYGTTVEAIMQANNLTSLAIYVGQELLVPVPPDTAPTPTPRRRQVVHVVQPGEYLEIIAERYGVSVRAIMEANALTSDVIYPGQRLVIPIPATPEP